LKGEEIVMVSAKVYFYYLKRAFKANHIHGYSINRKCNRKTCIYKENGKWNVAEVKRNETHDLIEYDEDCLWRACEDIIARLSKNENQRKKTWMDWASPTNWAEKMDEPIVAIPISQEELEKLIKSRKG